MSGPLRPIASDLRTGFYWGAQEFNYCFAVGSQFSMVAVGFSLALVEHRYAMTKLILKALDQRTLGFRIHFLRYSRKLNLRIALRKVIAAPLLLEEDDRFAGGIIGKPRSGW